MIKTTCVDGPFVLQKYVTVFQCELSINQFTTVSVPYKHRTSGLSEGFQRQATPWRTATFQPLDGTEVGCKVGPRRAPGGPLEASL